jgi:hypothetical protein
MARTKQETSGNENAEKKERKPREPISVKFEKAGKMIMNAMNDNEIHSESDVVALISKAFMNEVAKNKIEARIANLEAKLKAMKDAVKA